MIKISEMNKSFDGFVAIENMNLNVKKGSNYGLVGINGSGKTTLIKHLTGVYIPDSGSVTIEEQQVFENQNIKSRIGYIPDDLYFFGTYTLKDSARFYKNAYKKWSVERYNSMLYSLQLNEKRKLSKFSKGMQKQAAFILAMSSMPDYLILDEPIDGLDPIVRKLVWKYIVTDVAERNMTVLVSSHNLKELEGICDSIGILSNGKMMLERDLDELKSDVHKIQVAFSALEEGANPYEGLNILHKETRGSVDLLIVKDKKAKVDSIIGNNKPVLFDMLPLTLEEIFIYELGGGDREIESIIF